MPNERGNKPVVHTRKHVARLERERRQTRLILYIFIAILVSVIGLVTYGFLDVAYFQLERPVARVGDVELKTRDFETRVRLQRNQMLNNLDFYQQYQLLGIDLSSQIQDIEMRLSFPESIGQTVLDQMINEELIRQEAASRGLTVSEAEIEAAIRENLGYYPDGTPTPAPTATESTAPTLSPQTLLLVSPTPTPSPTLAQTLTPTASPTPTDLPEGFSSPTSTLAPTATATPAPTGTPGPTFTPQPTATAYTLAGYEEEYARGLEDFGKLGLTEELYRAFFEVNLLREKLMDEVAADVTHSQVQVWARHILVPDQAAADEVLARLAAGEEFGAVAAELSDDTGSALSGGDVGWVAPNGQFVPEFETAALALEAGEISEPVQSSFGLHIIQAVAKQERPLSESEYEAARQKVFDDFLASLREKYEVETFEEQWLSHVPDEPNQITRATEAARPPDPE